MIVTIPTYGRVHKQVTLEQLPPSILDITFLVVQHRERYEYEWYDQVVVLPPEITTIGPTRQWMVENLNTIDHKQVQIDDDLTFAKRRTDDPTRFTPASSLDIESLFGEIKERLEQYAQVGVGHREGGNYATDDTLFNTRITRMFGLRTDVLSRDNIRFDRLECKVDFDLSLQLLRAGYDNCVINTYVHNQSGSNKSGGCSHFRTHEVLERAAYRLAELHPGFVQVVKKVTKTAWGGGERVDVRIAWKNARRSATIVRTLDPGAGERSREKGVDDAEALEPRPYLPVGLLLQRPPRG